MGVLSVSSQFASKVLAEGLAVTQLAGQLTDVQRHLLQSLKDKGPGLPLELSVRILKFPEDIQEPLSQLKSLGLVDTQTVSGGHFGAELFTLTASGEVALQLLKDPSFQHKPQASSAEVDMRQQEVELLKKLGDLAKEKGEYDKALEYYLKALAITGYLPLPQRSVISR